MREGFGGLKIGPGGGGGGGGLQDPFNGVLPIKDDVNTGFPDGDAIAPLDYG